MARNENSNSNCKIKNKYENWFNYNWVLNELNKDFDIEGIDRIGFTDDGYEVFIVTDDYMLSDAPHFHYRKKEKGKKMGFHTCIRLDKAEYYHHIGNEDILSDTQKENLIVFLEGPSKLEKYDTNWELIKDLWNLENLQQYVDGDQQIPDYRNLQ